MVMEWENLKLHKIEILSKYAIVRQQFEHEKIFKFLDNKFQFRHAENQFIMVCEFYDDVKLFINKLNDKKFDNKIVNWFIKSLKNWIKYFESYLIKLYVNYQLGSSEFNFMTVENLKLSRLKIMSSYSPIRQQFENEQIFKFIDNKKLLYECSHFESDIIYEFYDNVNEFLRNLDRKEFENKIVDLFVKSLNNWVKYFESYMIKNYVEF